MSAIEKDRISKQMAGLRDSIAHWERLESGHRYTDREAPTAQFCACCNTYRDRISGRDNGSNACDGCPIREVTGALYCDDTPYDLATIAWDKHGLDSDEFKEAAREELMFLRRLLRDLEVKYDNLID